MVEQLPGSGGRSEGSEKSELEEKREKYGSPTDAGAKDRQHIVPLSVSPIPDGSSIMEVDFDAKKAIDNDKYASGPGTASDENAKIRDGRGEWASG